MIRISSVFRLFLQVQRLSSGAAEGLGPRELGATSPQAVRYSEGLSVNISNLPHMPKNHQR